jgi:release factor glutamine methyltransferase
MTIAELNRIFLQKLSGIYSKNESSEITKLTFEALANLSRADILINPGLQLSLPIETNLIKALDELMNHKPVQYITGYTWFYKLRFNLSENVLIPRPETEELVDEVVQYLKQNRHQKILDIGSGSGCIPISIKKNNSDCLITSIDISAEAIEMAQKNAALNEVSINFQQVDFLNEAAWNELELYNCIVSNPPYIPISELTSIEKNVKDFEPHLALFVPDTEPLIFYEKILKFSDNHLQVGGVIFMETHENYAEAVMNLFKEKGFEASLKLDLLGKSRMVMATRCQ